MNLMHGRLYHFMFATLSLVLCFNVLAQIPTPTDIEYGYPESPPRTFTNAKGEPEGTHFRVAKALFSKAGISWHATSYPPLRLIKNLQTGATNFSILVKNEALVDCCIYSREPIDLEEIMVYWKENQSRIKSREDLIGKHIIVVRGYSYGGLISFLKDPVNKITIETAKDHLSAFDMLKLNRADYVIEYLGSANEALEQRPAMKNLPHEVVNTIGLYLVLSKTYPDADRAMVHLEEIYRALDKNSQLKNYNKIK